MGAGVSDMPGSPKWQCKYSSYHSIIPRGLTQVVGSCSSLVGRRTWADCGRVVTKDRNRAKVQTALDMVFVRRWLRKSFRVLSGEESAVFKEWEKAPFPS